MCDRKVHVMEDERDVEIGQVKIPARLLEKLAGYMFPYSGARRKAFEMYCDSIESDPVATQEEKAIRLANAGREFRYRVNQDRIARQAVMAAKPGTDFSQSSGVDLQWLDQFFDRARFISREEAQALWSHVLAREFERPGSVSYQLVRILGEITPEQASAFERLCGMCAAVVEENADGDIRFHDRLLFFDLSTNHSRKTSGISQDELDGLESAGLLSSSSPGILTRCEELQEDCRFVHICFGQEVLSLRAVKGVRLPLGSEALSPCGLELMRIVLPTFDAGVIERLRGYYERWPDFDIQLDVMPLPLLEVEADCHWNIVASKPINR